MIDVVREPVKIEAVLRAVDDDASGGAVFFIGRVRDHNNGKKVTHIRYEGYVEMARSELGKIANAVSEKWPVQKIALVHRLGDLCVGEASIVIAVACAHRAQAFEACRYAIDMVKQRVPVWKKEFGPDGAFWAEGQVPNINI